MTDLEVHTMEFSGESRPLIRGTEETIGFTPMGERIISAQLVDLLSTRYLTINKEEK